MNKRIKKKKRKQQLQQIMYEVEMGINCHEVNSVEELFEELNKPLTKEEKKALCDDFPKGGCLGNSTRLDHITQKDIKEVMKRLKKNK